MRMVVAGQRRAVDIVIISVDIKGSLRMEAES